jgi:hypothetical protein
LFLVTRRDGTTERAVFYAASKSEACRLAWQWARRLDADLELVEGDEAA